MPTEARRGKPPQSHHRTSIRRMGRARFEGANFLPGWQAVEERGARAWHRYDPPAGRLVGQPPFSPATGQPGGGPVVPVPSPGDLSPFDALRMSVDPPCETRQRSTQTVVAARVYPLARIAASRFL